MVLAVVAVIVSVLVAVPALNRQTSDVAGAVSEQVGARVVGDARLQRLLIGRRELAEANARLVARNLPIVPDPGPQASGDELLIQAARANVIADLPESQVAGLRNLPGNPATLPSALTDGDPDNDASARELSDRVVTVLPLVPGQGAVDTPRERRGGSAGGNGSGGSSGNNGRSSGSDGSSSGSNGGSAGSGNTARPPANTGTTRPPGPNRPGLLEPCVLGILLC